MSVNDPTDKPVPRAQVSIVDLSNSQNALFRTTDDRGMACVQLRAGKYSVESSVIGFLNVRYYPVRVEARAIRRVVFRLPIGEVFEGGIGEDAVVSGVITVSDELVEGARVCLVSRISREKVTCSITDDLGEYAFSVPPSRYLLEVIAPDRTVYRKNLDLTSGGYYREKQDLKHWKQ